ncbi:hypothetical protein [Streptomyces sp. G-G2]|uniref:hypothetical protein n=1 Tax=Streptomyces sp. G-G2 TaxID=3046201 RepID=UPI0024BA02FC|nr:hypothetical protein [Streptomyces sp. G-G2]MDJ0381905.1 hypothetical protein [Streptomyces sp. G-G2]
MGVFDRFRRKSAEATEESVVEPAEEVAAAAPTAGSEVTDEVAAATETPAPEGGVEIPKQQCAEEAADSEAGEGART